MSDFPYNTRTHRVEGASFTILFFSAFKDGITEVLSSRNRGGGRSSKTFAPVVYRPTGKPVFSAERIQRSVAVFDSRPIVMSSDVASWKKLSWTSTVPEGTKLYAYVRTAATDDLLRLASWKGPLLNGELGEDISSQSGRILQFRMAMYSAYDPSTETLLTPVIETVLASCYVRGAAQKFYTTATSLGFSPTHVLLTYNGSVPTDTIIRFAVSTKDSIDPSDYKIIDPNTVVGIEEISRNSFLKIAVSAIGNTEVPFVVDEFAIAVGGGEFARITQ